ncbi:MAG: LPS-assembly protein LptD [Gammaproteobacteria bacterium]
MIFVIACFGSSEIVYSQNICIVNDIDDFLTRNDFIASGLSNEIRITSGNNTITAGQASYDESGSSINVSGGVTLENPNLFIQGQAAFINTDDETAVLKNTQYFFPNIPARGSSEEFRIEKENHYVLTKPTYTTCNQMDQSWELVADEISINGEEGKATNIALRFKNIPILYLPKLTFPTNDDRKSGFLIPSFGSSSKRGLEIEIPYYWNIAPNADLKTTVNWMKKRGTEIKSELRFLTSSQNAKIELNHLPSDDLFNDDRTYSKINYQFNPSLNTQIEVTGEYASDTNYFEDLSQSTNESSRTHLARDVVFKSFGKNWMMNLGMTNYQMLDDQPKCLAIGICDQNDPYRLKPYMNFNGNWQSKESKINLNIDSELVFFDHLQSESGERISNRTTLSKLFNFSGIEVRPAVAIDYAKFKPDSNEKDANRTIPIYSLDIKANLIKITNNGVIRRSIQPRIMAVYIPFEDQSDFPFIDTLMPDFNYFQLFNENRFIGNDRIGDTSKISYGIVAKRTRIQSGKDFFEFTLGQTLHLKDEKIAMPGDSIRRSGSLTNLASLDVAMTESLNLKLDHYWDSDVDEMKRSQIGIEYKDSGTKRLNLAYRFRKQNIKQVHGSFSWPIKDQWSFIGHYKYSIKDRKTIDQFFGLNYETCCWSISAVSRKHLVYRNGETDTSFSIQFMFKGLGEFGTPINRIFEDGIFAYDQS